MIRSALPADGGAFKALVLAYIGSPRSDGGKLDVLIAELQSGRIGRQWMAADAADRLVGFVTPLLYVQYPPRSKGCDHERSICTSPRRSAERASLFAAIRDFAKQVGCAYLGWETAADKARA